MASRIQASSDRSGRVEETALLLSADSMTPRSGTGTRAVAPTTYTTTSTTIGQAGDDGEQKYETSPLRWLVLVLSAMLNFSSGMNWVTFTAIADHGQNYYDVKATQINFLSMVFMISSLVSGLGWAWLLDHVGLGVGLWLGSWMNCGGVVLRYFSTHHPSLGLHGHFGIVLGGQILCALANPIGLYSPAKVADMWFPQKRRALANMCCSMANPIGMAMGMLLPPLFVDSSNNLPAQFSRLMWVECVIPGLTLLLTLFLYRNKPKVPPSPSGDDKKNIKLPFGKGFIRLFKNRSFLQMALMWSVGVGSFNVFITLMQQMLCPYGYTDKFVGTCGASMSAAGLVGAAVCSVYVDQTKKFVQTLKICYALALMSLLGYLLVSFHAHMHGPLLFLLTLFGLFGYAQLPIMVELAVETTYPVNTGVCSAVLWMCGQLMGFLLLIVTSLPLFSRELNAEQRVLSTCTNKNPKDLTYAGLFVAVLAAILTCVFILTFRTAYRRLHSERYAAAGTPEAEQKEPEMHW